MLFRHRHVVLLLALTVALLLWLKPTECYPCLPLSKATFQSALFPEVSNSTLGFQNIFTINLPSRTDRRDAMTLAAALSELDITWVDGVAGRDVDDNVLPRDHRSRQGGFTVGNKGSWRAHMNVLQRIVRENLTSGLVLEDDTDWDVRLKAQMQLFAQAARAFTQRSNGQTLAQQYHNQPDPTLPIEKLPRRVTRPARTPYGDDWDVLWLGHCGTELPTRTNRSKVLPLQVVILSDDTVPSPKRLRSHPFALQDALSEQYPPHTRVVHGSSGTTCTQAYAVSQQGARKLLLQFGLQTLSAGWDLMLRDWCDGLYISESEADTAGGRSTRAERRDPVCVTVQPPLFSHHYGKGAVSDIMAPGGGFVNSDREMTPYIKRSVRLNMERLIEGQGAEEQWNEEDQGGDR